MNLHVITALVLTGVASCEPAQFTHPLSDPSTAKLDLKLVGTWAGRDDDAEFTVFIEPKREKPVLGAPSTTAFDVLLVAHGPTDGVVSIAWEALPSTVGGKTYLNLREKVFSNAFENQYTLKPTYALVRYELNGDVVHFSALESLDVDGGTELLTTPTPALAAAIQKLPASAFKSFIAVKRFKAPPFKAR